MMNTRPQSAVGSPQSQEGIEDTEAKLQSMMEAVREEATREGYTEVTMESLVGEDEERPDTGDSIKIYRFAERDVEAGMPAKAELKVEYRITTAGEKLYRVNGAYQSANCRGQSVPVEQNILEIRDGGIAVRGRFNGLRLKSPNTPALIFIKKTPKSVDEDIQTVEAATSDTARRTIQ